MAVAIRSTCDLNPADEDVLANSLDAVSPADVLKSEVLSTSFRAFLGRATTEELLQLLPIHPYSTSILSNNVPNLISHSIPATQTVVKVSRYPVSADSPSPGSSEHIASFCATAGIQVARISLVTRLIQSFAKAEQLPTASYGGMWSYNEDVFDLSKQTSRIRRLHQGRMRLKVVGALTACAARLCLLFFVNDIDYHIVTWPKSDLNLSTGRDRKTAILERIAETNKIAKETLLEDRKKSKNYFELLREPGPGSLLELGANASDWESKASVAELRCAIRYREEYLPHLHKRAVSLNAVAALAIVNGLRAYGWESHEIRSVPTALLTEIQKYLKIAKLTNNGLIKVKSTMGRAGEFWLHCLCTGRSLLNDNFYIAIMRIAEHDQASCSLAIALVCLYSKGFMPAGSPQKTRLENQEKSSLQKAMALLHQERSQPAMMLLIHHAIIHPELHKMHWTDYLYQLDGHTQAAFVIATHAIWLMTILPLTERYSFQGFDYDWIGQGELNDLTKVHGIVGTSRELVYYQYLITNASRAPPTTDWGIWRRIIVATQWVDSTEGEMPTRIALETAATYKLATQLYFLVRLQRFTPSDPRVSTLCAKLTQALCRLPASGDEYSGLHPAFCFVIAAACTDNQIEYANMSTILKSIGSANKSNVSTLVQLIGWIWAWKKERALMPGWWEEMVDHLDEMMGGKLFCIT